jgi:hypothetical protein
MRGARAMDRIQRYTDMEARYRKQADNEPVRREKHTADADAWRLLADTRRFAFAKQAEMRNWIATLSK